MPVAELVGRPGASRSVRGTYELPGLELATTGTRADDAVEVDVEISTIVQGLTIDGSVRGRWRADCRRCLEAVDGVIDVVVAEIFEDEPTEGETWPIEAEHVDLEPVVREAVMLALPLSPLCGPQCAGPEPDRFPTAGRLDEEQEPDPRWAALDDLEFD
ncbi:MAG: DUF177 domain-containing protein [Acidimicrobiia bacterium]|nr:DUF177 domain-containing protein [Acidimicrobiia bacterium]